MDTLSPDTLVVFISDSHIGGDPGCDGFEASAELEALFASVMEHEGPVEVILAGDFFDFLQIGDVPEGSNRAKATISREEYRTMFEALEHLRSREGCRVVYLPGNHDAEVEWNPAIQKTLVSQGLVDEFAHSYAARLGKYTVYCEHGNQFDPENTVEDYGDPLDTPLGHHVVMDFTRRIAPLGEVARGLNLAEIKMVFPLSAIPLWVASRYFYNLVQRLITSLLLPILVVYALYRVVAYLVGLGLNHPVRFLTSYQEFPRIHELLVGTFVFGVIVVLIFVVFGMIVRRSLRRSLLALGNRATKTPYDPAKASREKIEAMLRSKAHPPMNGTVNPTEVDVFVSGHTHLPSLEELHRPDGRTVVAVNSGCWLRQLQPTKPRFRGPPVFVSRFVLTHVRVYLRGDELRVELWDCPRPATQTLNSVEKLVSRKIQVRGEKGSGEPYVLTSATLKR